MENYLDVIKKNLTSFNAKNVLDDVRSKAQALGAMGRGVVSGFMATPTTARSTQPAELTRTVIRNIPNTPQIVSNAFQSVNPLSPKMRADLMRDATYTPGESGLVTAGKTIQNISKGGIRGLIREPYRILGDIGGVGTGLMTGKYETPRSGLGKYYSDVGGYLTGKRKITPGNVGETGMNIAQALEPAITFYGTKGIKALPVYSGLTAGIGGAGSLVTGGKFSEGAQRALVEQAPQVLGDIGVLSGTDFMTKGISSGIKRQLTKAGGNVAQGIIYDKVRGYETTPLSIAIDAFAPGVLDSSDLLIKTSQKKIKQVLGKRPKHQAEIERAINAGNIKRAREIINTLDDQYRQPMESIIKILEEDKNQIENLAQQAVGGQKQFINKTGAVYRSINKITPVSEAVNKTKVDFFVKQLKANNYIDPVLIGKEGNKWVVREGGDRLEAYKRLGYQTVPTKIVSGDNLKGVSQTAGAMAGVEMYQDEQGNWQTRFNPEKAVLGLGVTTGINKFKGSRKSLTGQIDSLIKEGNQAIGATKTASKKPIKQVLSDVYTQWVDRYNPLIKASQKAKQELKTKGAELRPEYDPEYLVRRLTGAGGIADVRFNTQLKPIIDSIDKTDITKLDLDTYLAHSRMAGFGEAGRDIYGSNPAKSKQIVTALESKYPEIKAFAQQLYQYQDEGLQELKQAGFLSDKAIASIKSQNPNYAPLNRVMEEMNNYLGLPARKTMQGTSPVLKIKGSTKQIESPLENIIGNTFKQRAAIEKNRVAKSLVGLQEITDLGFKKVAKSTPTTITVWNNGNKEYWEVGQEIAETAKGLNEESTNALLKIIQAPASLLRQGATGRNLEFMIPNIIRDQLDAGITSKYGYIPFIDYASGLTSMLKNDEIYQKWASSGAKIDLGELSGKKSIQKLFDEKKARKGLMSWITSGLDVLGKYSEQPTRVGLFKKAYQKTGNELIAAMESRDATVDFARMGSKMKVANSIIPFLNVGVQGFDKLIRAAKNKPGKVLLNASIYGGLPAIASTVYNISNHPEEYHEIPQYEKDSNFVFVNGRNEDGTVSYFTIPKGNVLPIITNPIQSFLEYLAGTSKQTFDEFATQFISSSLPVVGDGQSLQEVAVKTIGGNLPQAIKPITENLLNKSFYKYDTKKEQTKEIVPSYLTKKFPYEQAYEWTPTVYKTIGAALNVSPLQVQNLMEGYLAGYAKIPVNLVETMKLLGEGENVEQNSIPILRRFMKETYPTEAKKETTTKEVPSFWERITGGAPKAEATDLEKYKQKVSDKLYEDITPKEIKAYYGEKLSLTKTGNAYQNALNNKEMWSKFNSIENNDNLTQEQKDGAINLILNEAGVSRRNYDYYQVATQPEDIRTVYIVSNLNTELAKDNSPRTLYGYLAMQRLNFNGKQILTSGVIDNLVDQQVLSYEDGKALKKIGVEEVNGKYKLVLPKPKVSKAKKRKKMPTIKISKLKAPKLPKAIRLKSLTRK